MRQHKTEQENFWAGEFGDRFVDRHIDRSKREKIITSNVALFSKIIARTDSISSIIEFGPNMGLNLIVLRRLLPNADLSAVEINQNAVKQLDQIGDIKIYPISMLDFKPDTARDLVLIKGVLMHTNPDELGKVYELLYRTSRRYICIVEYYNPSPAEVIYRGYKEKLFKRDFAGEIMDKYKDLKLVDYGFVYHRDPNFPLDDPNWFLLEKMKQK